MKFETRRKELIEILYTPISYEASTRRRAIAELKNEELAYCLEQPKLGKTIKGMLEAEQRKRTKSEPFVSHGLRGDTFATYRRKASGSLERVKSPDLPVRDTREEAQRDLDAWLAKKGRK